MQGDPITLKVNKLMSVKNLPYEYYSLPYCRPDKIISSAENLGEVLRGDRIENSPYQVQAAAAECRQWGHMGVHAKGRQFGLAVAQSCGTAASTLEPPARRPSSA